MKSVPTHSTRTAPAKILVLGATGGTSRSIVTQALARGNEVTLLARSPEKAGNLKGVKVVAGDARDEQSLRQGHPLGRQTFSSELGRSPLGSSTAPSSHQTPKPLWPGE